MSAIYAGASQAFANGTLNWTTASLGLMLVGPAYTPNFAADTTLANIPSAAQLLPAPVALTSPTVVAGWCKAANVGWGTLTTSSPVKSVVILWQVSGTWNLLCLLDQGSGFGQTATAVPANVLFDSRGIFQP